MELAIRPDHLYAAAAALDACGARLDTASLTFAREATAALPKVGANAAEAAGRGLVAAEHAVELLSADIARLAHALAALAHHYPRVDATAMPPR
jgi:hypothetical protein